MKVLLFTPFYDGNPINAGGISIWGKNLKEYYDNLQDKSGLELDILSANRDRFVPTESSFLHRLYYGIVDYSRKLRDLRKKLSHGQYDVVHICTSASFGLFKDLLAIKMVHRHKAKAIIHYRFGRIPELASQNNWEWRMIKRVVKLADKSIVIDRNSFDTLREEGFDSIAYVPNPLQPTTDSLIKSKGIIKRDANTLLFVGHVVESKGVKELIEVVKHLNNVHLKMAGIVEDDYKKELIDLAGPNSGNWLSILGHVSPQDAIELMLECGIFVLPTHTEGFPNVILEAMACGCAIVASEVGAIPEMLENENGNHYGLLIKPKDHAGLKDAIMLYLEDETLRSECQKNARERVISRYSMPRVWEQMLTIWRGVVMT